MTVLNWNTPNGNINAMPLSQWGSLALNRRVVIENALDSGRIYAETRKGTLWLVRRNGKTKTWKRDQDRFEIPAKAGFRDCFTICGGNGYLSAGLWVKVNEEADG